MKKIIKLQRDFMFTTIFNKEKNVAKLEKFIAVYFGYPYEKVHGNLKLIKRDLEKKTSKEGKKQVDLLLTLDNMKKNINIEIDKEKSDRIKNRNTVYVGKIAGELNKKEGDDYSMISSTTQIAFNINTKPQIKGLLIDEQRIMSVNTGKLFSDKIEIDEINMSVVDELDYNLLEEKEKIVYNFIKMLQSEDVTEFERISERLMEKEESKDLTKQVEELSQDVRYVEMEGAYENDDDYWEDIVREKTLNAHHESKIETAKKMLEEKLNINLISKCTNLSIEEINNIK